jgi:hypothetical protein
MKGLKAVLDIAALMVHLKSPTHGNVVLQLPSSTPTSSALHSTAAQNLEDIPVACEFPDVFQETYQAYLRIRTWSSPLNYSPVMHPSLDGHTR